MDSFATHLPTLIGFIDTFHPQTVFEFGMGLNSTPVFLNKCKKTISVEMQERGWYDRVYLELAKFPEFYPILALGPFFACDLLRGMHDRFDLIFVDGHGHSRWQQISDSFSKTDVIIVHDTEAIIYEWPRVSLPYIFGDSWTLIEFREFVPWTSILTRKPAVSDWAKLQKCANVFNNFTEKGYCR